MITTRNESVRLRFERSTLSRLRALERRIRAYVLADSLAVIGPVLLAAVLITLGIDHTLRLDRSTRLVQGLVVVAVIGWAVWRHLLRPMMLKISQTDLASLIERHHPQLDGRLVSAAEFVPAGAVPPSRASTALMDKVIEQAEEVAAGLRFTDVLDHRRAVRHAGIAVAGFAAVAVLLILAPTTMGLWFERNVMLRNVAWPVRNHLTVEGLKDGKLVVPRGDDVVISAMVDPGYEPPRQAYVQFRGTSGLRGRAQMPEVRGQPVRFTHTFERLAESLTCQIVGGDAQTPPFTIEVIDRPSITAARIGITPPPYTKLEPYDLREGQIVAEALKGSEIRLQIAADQPVTSAVLVRETDGKQAALGPAQRVSDREFNAADQPATSAAYHFELTSTAGLSNVSPRAAPTRFTVHVTADEAPTVKMKMVGVGEIITAQAVLPVEVEFSDAYGLATADMVFVSAKAEGKPVAEPLAGFEPSGKAFGRSIDWSVAEHKLSEGDRLTLWAEAADFDNVSGPNVGKSPPVVFRIVSREELAAELNRRQREYRQDFERYLRRQEDLYSELLSATQEAATEAERRQQGQRLRQLARRQRDQTGQVTAIAQQFEQVLSEMRINALSTPAVEERLGRGVGQPLRELTRERMPAAADTIERLAGDDGEGLMQEARGAQASIREEMNNILTRMLEWERLEEAVILLRDVLNMQKNVGKETENSLEHDILGTAPATGPSK